MSRVCKQSCKCYMFKAPSLQYCRSLSLFSKLTWNSCLLSQCLHLRLFFVQRPAWKRNGSRFFCSHVEPVVSSPMHSLTPSFRCHPPPTKIIDVKGSKTCAQARTWVPPPSDWAVRHGDETIDENSKRNGGLDWWMTFCRKPSDLATNMGWLQKVFAAETHRQLRGPHSPHQSLGRKLPNLP